MRDSSLWDWWRRARVSKCETLDDGVHGDDESVGDDDDDADDERWPYHCLGSTPA